MSKKTCSIPKGFIAIRRENLNFSFTHFLAHPASGHWVVGTKEEFESGEMLSDLREDIQQGGKLEWFELWSSKYKTGLGTGSKIFHIIR